MTRWRVPLLGCALLGTQAVAMTDAQLAERLRQRFEGDRTGACVLAAVVDGERIARARFCARDAQPPADDAAFEIGSIAKTMAAFLVADLVEQRGWTLDDPIARHLPGGAPLREFEAQPIRVRHLLTHTSGLPPLPPGLAPRDPRNPYADLDEAALLQALARTRLAAAPGALAQYSNFGMLVLSLAVARAHGGDLEAALRSRLFQPLGMAGASLRPDGVQGHAPGGQPVPAWTSAPALAGAGLVRASLDDMLKYLQAQLGTTPTPLAARMQRTQQPLAAGFGMAWSLPVVQGRSLVLHEGGTGGFSALLAFDPAARKGVVMLADTALADLGGLGDAALPLIVDLPLAGARRALAIPPRLLQALPGRYAVQGTPLVLELRTEGGLLVAQASGQPALPLAYDSRGDLSPPGAEYLLRPLRDHGRVDRLQLRQGGGVLEAVRMGEEIRPRAHKPEWQAFAGEYVLAPGFSIRVFEQDGRLQVQGTGQRAIAAEQTGPDRIEIQAVGAVIDFQREASGDVLGVTLRQGGQVLRGAKRR